MLALLLILSVVLTAYFINNNELDQDEIHQMIQSDDWFN
tara:strand:+ start:1908 stop:2024 length:117 start_codon:yes stop_codon:yes gene_type:complete